VDRAAIEPLFGTYAGHGGAPIRFFARDGTLYFGRGDEEKAVLPAAGDRFYFGPKDLTWFRILRQPDGAHVMEIHPAEAAAPARSLRTGPVPAAFEVARSVLQSYVGTYKTETIAVTVELAANGRLTITPAGQPALPMRPVSNTEFRIDGTPMRIVFHPEHGKVNRFTLYRGARELHGTRTGG
jgi:hypothetical protein